MCVCVFQGRRNTAFRTLGPAVSGEQLCGRASGRLDMCFFGCLYLDALEGNSQGVSLSFQAEERGELDTALDPGPGELGSHPGPVTC